MQAQRLQGSAFIFFLYLRIFSFISWISFPPLLFYFYLKCRGLWRKGVTVGAEEPGLEALRLSLRNNFEIHFFFCNANGGQGSSRAVRSRVESVAVVSAVFAW